MVSFIFVLLCLSIVNAKISNSCGLCSWEYDNGFLQINPNEDSQCTELTTTECFSPIKSQVRWIEMSNIYSIASDVFAGFKSLEFVSFNTERVSIAASAFTNARRLKAIHYAGNRESVCSLKHAFKGSQPASISLFSTGVNNRVFCGHHFAKNRIIEGSYGVDTKWQISNGYLVITGKGAMTEEEQEAPWKKYSKQIHTIIVNGMTTISSQAFSDMKSVKALIITKPLVSIGADAFTGNDKMVIHHLELQSMENVFVNGVLKAFLNPEMVLASIKEGAIITVKQSTRKMFTLRSLKQEQVNEEVPKIKNTGAVVEDPTDDDDDSTSVEDGEENEGNSGVVVSSQQTSGEETTSSVHQESGDEEIESKQSEVQTVSSQQTSVEEDVKESSNQEEIIPSTSSSHQQGDEETTVSSSNQEEVIPASSSQKEDEEIITQSSSQKEEEITPASSSQKEEEIPVVSSSQKEEGEETTVSSSNQDDVVIQSSSQKEDEVTVSSSQKEGEEITASSSQKEEEIIPTSSSQKEEVTTSSSQEQEEESGEKESSDESTESKSRSEDSDNSLGSSDDDDDEDSDEDSDDSSEDGSEAEERTDKCGEYCYWEIVNNVLTIWGKGDMDDYDQYNNTAPWSDLYDEILSIKFKKMGTVILNGRAMKEETVFVGLTSIGDYAFYGLSRVTTVEFIDTITSIGTSAFGKCTSIKKIELPSSVVTIEDRAFEHCAALKEIFIPASVEFIGEDVFLGCFDLETVYFDGTSDICRGNITLFTDNVVIKVKEHFKDDEFCGSSTLHFEKNPDNNDKLIIILVAVAAFVLLFIVMIIIGVLYAYSYRLKNKKYDLAFMNDEEKDVEKLIDVMYLSSSAELSKSGISTPDYSSSSSSSTSSVSGSNHSHNSSKRLETPTKTDKSVGKRTTSSSKSYTESSSSSDGSGSYSTRSEGSADHGKAEGKKDNIQQTGAVIQNRNSSNDNASESQSGSVEVSGSGSRTPSPKLPSHSSSLQSIELGSK